jgi:hypothetical protein
MKGSNSRARTLFVRFVRWSPSNTAATLDGTISPYREAATYATRRHALRNHKLCSRVIENTCDLTGGLTGACGSYCFPDSCSVCVIIIRPVHAFERDEMTLAVAYGHAHTDFETGCSGYRGLNDGV